MDNESFQNKENSATSDTIQMACVLSLRVLLSVDDFVQGRKDVKAGPDTEIIYGPHRASKAFKLLETI